MRTCQRHHFLPLGPALKLTHTHPQLEPQACDQIFNTQGHLGTLLSSTTVPDDASVANLGPHLGTKSVDDVHCFLDCWFRPFLPSRGRLTACSLRFQSGSLLWFHYECSLLSALPVAVVNYPNRSNLRKNGFLLAHSPSWWGSQDSGNCK